MRQDQVSGLDGVAYLVANAVDVLAADRSIEAVAAEINVRAALDALASAGARITAGEAAQTDQRHVDNGDAAEAVVLAERAVLALPPAIRGQVAVCAAAVYLRMARRALVQR